MATKQSAHSANTNRAVGETDRFNALVRRLEHLSGLSLDVRFHRNRWVYFSCRQTDSKGPVRVRLHEAFLGAPPRVIRALATLLKSENQSARRIVNSFVDEQSHIWDELSDRPPRPLKIEPQGKVYDLWAIFNDLNKRYFGGRCSALITWGNSSRRRRRARHIVFGYYDESAGVIRINPLLDRRSVPEYFVRYIVYHEMLHATLPATVSPSGRHIYHSRLFRQRERMFEDYQRAKLWGERFIEGKA